MNKYETTFLSILKKGSKDNTYKFALARFLLDFSKSYELSNKKEILIDYELISKSFLKYYWYQECKYRLKQDFKVSKMPTIIREIRVVCGESYIPQTYENYFEDNYNKQEELVKYIALNCLNDVIPRFHTGLESNLYVHDCEKVKSRYRKSKTRSITLKRDALKFMKDNYDMLSNLVILEWAKFLEKTNFTHKLISKIETLTVPSRSSLNKYRKILLETTDLCFYCEKPLVENQIDVVHFIPWSYIFDDNLWNLVLACYSCNRKKSDKLTSKKSLKDLDIRNSKYFSDTKTGFDDFEIPYSKLEEYYDNCKSSGFCVK